MAGDIVGQNQSLFENLCQPGFISVRLSIPPFSPQAEISVAPACSPIWLVKGYLSIYRKFVWLLLALGWEASQFLRGLRQALQVMVDPERAVHLPFSQHSLLTCSVQELLGTE